MIAKSKIYSSKLIKEIKDNKFPMYHILGYGKEYTSGKENLTRKQFNIFLGSCAYLVYFESSLSCINYEG